MKIYKEHNRKTRKGFYRARFQFEGVPYNIKADTRKELNELVDEIKVQARRQKLGLTTVKVYPSFENLLNRHKQTLLNNKHKLITFERVSENLLNLMPIGIKVNELKKAYFQNYIDWRLNQISQKTGDRVLPQTVDKELYSVSKALTNAPLYFAELEDYQKFVIPKASKGKKRERTQVIEISDFEKLLAELRKERTGKQTNKGIAYRKRLADELEFKIETGLRRKETVRLLKSQYSKVDGCLKNVIRFKTDSVTKFFPLSRRAIEIVESRLTTTDSIYLFSEKGESHHADYRTIKTVCEQIGVDYGMRKENGFVPHDLRRNFATAVSLKTDIETTRVLLGHTDIKQTSTYLGTNQDRLISAVRPNEIISVSQMVEFYKGIKRGRLKLKKFVEKVQQLTKKK